MKLSIYNQIERHGEVVNLQKPSSEVVNIIQVITFEANDRSLALPIARANPLSSERNIIILGERIITRLAF